MAGLKLRDVTNYNDITRSCKGSGRDLTSVPSTPFPLLLPPPSHPAKTNGKYTRNVSILGGAISSSYLHTASSINETIFNSPTTNWLSRLNQLLIESLIIELYNNISIFIVIIIFSNKNPSIRVHWNSRGKPSWRKILWHRLGDQWWFPSCGNKPIFEELWRFERVRHSCLGLRQLLCFSVHSISNRFSKENKPI